MKLALVLFKEDGSKREHVVSGGRVLIGRTDDADLQAPSKAVSRKHCEIRIDGDTAIVRDMGSSNGTYHNETLLEGEATLSPGDRIGVGPFVFTVQIDGEPARACLMLAAQAEGAEIRTVEGLEPAAGELSPLQAAFREHFALQCGFCTAGILISLDALLKWAPDASQEAIREHLSGHLCRCTGYAPIVKAALAAQAQMKEEEAANA